MQEMILEVWGDYACFSEPYAKVERLTYPFPTPSAVRGILSSIYSKPKEFYWQVNRIEVLSPIRYISFKRNEVKVTVSNKPIFTDEERTQRHTPGEELFDKSGKKLDGTYKKALSDLPTKDVYDRNGKIIEMILQ